MLQMSTTSEQASTWSVTGVAAAAALLISNLDSVGKIVSPGGLRLGLGLMGLALLFGAMSKQLGMVISSGLATMKSLEAQLQSPDGQSLFNGLKTDLRQLMDEMAAPFLWPMRGLIRRASVRGLTDYLAGDKHFVRLFCFQVYTAWLHWLCALGAIAAIVCSIKS